MEEDVSEAGTELEEEMLATDIREGEEELKVLNFDKIIL